MINISVDVAKKNFQVADANSPLVIFDSRVDDLPQLLAGLQPGVSAHVLDPKRNGVEQISQLMRRQPTASLTLVAHGFPGGLHLGAGALELGNLVHYERHLQEWFSSIAQPQLTLLACNVAAGDAGAEFIQQLQSLSQATITASANLVGKGQWPSIATELFTIPTLQAYRATLSWQAVGAPGFTAGTAFYTDLEFDSRGTPYVVYRDGDNDFKATVQKFNGVAWEVLGDAGFSARVANDTKLEFDLNDIPYVLYRDGPSNKTTVQKFNGVAWEVLGGPGFSAGAAYDAELKFDSSGTPYVVYQDGSNGGKATVQKFNDVAWEVVGGGGFSAGIASSTDLEFDSSGTPYVVYRDDANGSKATVQKFNGVAWEVLGGPGFSIGGAQYIDLEFDDGGVPHVVYQDSANRLKATVQKFNGVAWEVVGSPGFSAGIATFTDLEFDENGTPYIVYQDSANSLKATVQRFNGVDWEILGGAGFSAGYANDIDLEFGHGGNPYVVYRDDANGSKATAQFLDVAPIITRIVRQTPAGPITDADSVVFRAAFSEDVQNVDAADFTVTGGATAAITAVNPISADVYDITVSGGDLADFNGVVGLDVAIGQNITDLANKALLTTEPSTTETYILSNSDALAQLSPVPSANVLEITQQSEANAIRLQIKPYNIPKASEIRVYSTDANARDRNQIASFFLLEGDQLPDTYAPGLTIDSNAMADGKHLQFEMVIEGEVHVADLTSTSDTEVSLDFGDDAKVKVEVSNQTPITNLLVNDAAAIDLTGHAGNVNVNFTVYREATMDSIVGLYASDLADGGIRDALTGNILRPGDAGYQEAAFANHLDVQLTGENGQAKTFAATLSGGGFLSMFLVTHVSDPAAFASSSATDVLDPSAAEIYFSHAGANLNNNDHAKLLGDNAFGFEDKISLGDRDYNDIVVEFTIA